MWISAAICCVVAIVLGFQPYGRAIVYALRSAVFFPIGPWIAAQIWTLPVEICFYPILSVMLFLGRREWFEKLAMTLAVLSASYWLACSLGFNDPHTRLTQLLLLQHGCEFATGLFLWCAIEDRLTPARVMMMTICVASSFAHIATTADHESAGYGDRLPVMFPMAIWVTAVTLIYLSARFNMQADRYLAPYKKPVREIGLLTYPLYLIHFHIGGLVLFLTHKAAIGFGSAVALALVTCVALAGGYRSIPNPRSGNCCRAASLLGMDVSDGCGLPPNDVVAQTGDKIVGRRATWKR